MRFGPWMMGAFVVLAKLKFLRGTAFDVFGRTAERKAERALIGEYEALVDELLGRLAADNHAVAVELASLPEEIRGFGHVKDRHLAAVRQKWGELLARFRGQQSAQVIRMPVKAA
jgi:indolepyruvate ferredoxin oxidoreductase